MKLYTTKIDTASERKVVADDMILTKDMPTSAGSKMLDGYMSLFDAEVLTKLKSSGFTLSGKADVGEFSIDLLGETSYNGACADKDTLRCAAAEIVTSGDAMAAITLDVNGSVRRAAAQSGLVAIKPTYGTVSRYGTIPVVCSGETVSVMAKTVADCREVLSAIVGHDDKDGTSLPEDMCKKAVAQPASEKVSRVAVIPAFADAVGEDVKEKLAAVCDALQANGIQIENEKSDLLPHSRAAWNILMSAELCNNVSRYDGVKYGYRAEQFTNIDELYTNSRTEAFGELLKTAILFGSETLSTDNYMKVYDKALRVRRVVAEEFARLFESYDAVLIPACSALAYSAEKATQNKYMAFEENQYTAPASLTGLPVVTVGGMQLIGKACSEQALLDVAAMLEKEGK